MKPRNMVFSLLVVAFIIGWATKDVYAHENEPQAIDTQCSLKAAVFGKLWQDYKNNVPIDYLTGQLKNKMREDGAPERVINVWVYQLEYSLEQDEYYKMVGDVVYECLENGGL